MHRTGTVLAAVLAAARVAGANGYSYQEKPTIQDVVVVGVGPGRIYTASLFGAVPFVRDPAWRIRTYPLPHPHQTCLPEAVSLSRRATKALAVCAGQPVLLDLTAFPHRAELSRHAHRDPDALYFVPAGGGIDVWREGETALLKTDRIEGATHAVQLAGETRVAFLRGGVAFLRDASGGERPIERQTGPFSPGVLGNDALLLPADGAGVFVVDRTAVLAAREIPAGVFPAFPSRVSDVLPRPGNERIADFRVDPRQTGAGSVNWRYAVIAQPFAELYAPMLAFAKEETVFPSQATIWSQLPCPDPCSDHTLYDAYRSRPGPPWQDSSIYVKTVSYPGTWLHEFWLYYPFDVGGVSGHLHDSEHIFVEVDKLSGRPLAVLGAGHRDLTPNNNYSVVRRVGASPIPLPVRAIVELGKHATAPDINGDRHFTPGIDINLNAEKALVWGVRDAIGIGDSHFGAYDGSMTLPRREEDTLVSRQHTRWFGQRKGVESRTYALTPFPDGGPASVSKNAAAETRATEDYAIGKLRSNMNYKKPNTIYKTWVFPAWSARLGGVTGAGKGVSLTGAMSLFEATSLLAHVPLPGRIAFDVHLLDATAGKSLDKGAGVKRSLGYGVTYERLFTNLFGFYGGFARRRDGTDNGWRPGGTWYRGGALIEVPWSRGTLTIQAGALGSSALNRAAAIEFRASWAFWYRQNRHRFGRHHPRVWNSFGEY